MQSRPWMGYSELLMVVAIWACWGTQSGASGAYSVTALPGVGGGTPSNYHPTINDPGQIVGSWTPKGQVNPYPFLYDSRKGGQVTIPGLISPSGTNLGSYGDSAYFVGSNDRGQFLGAYEYAYRPGGPALFYDHGQAKPIPQVDTPVAINDAGQILYQSISPRTSQHIGLIDSYVEQGGVVTKVPNAPGSSNAEGVAINDRGMIAVNTTGLINPSGTGPAFSPTGPSTVEGRAFLLNGQTWTDLGTLGGLVSHATAMNANGDVVGWSDVNGQIVHAMMASFGKSMVDLGTLPGDSYSFAEGVNKFGQVVGYSYVSPRDNGAAWHGFLYQNGVMEDLNTLLPPNSGWTINRGVSINDLGQVLAFASSTNGGDGSLLLLSPDGMSVSPPLYPLLPITPTPEPSALAAFGVIVAALGWKTLRRRSGA